MGVTTETDVQIGARIRARREKIGLTQPDLARGMGVTFQQVQKYERGRNRVSATALILAAKTLRCSAAELLGETTSTEPGDGGFGDLYHAWLRLTPEQQAATLALMKTIG